MGSIYHHSILNIAATGFPDGQDGLFVKRDSNLMTPISISRETVQPEQANDGTNKEPHEKGTRKRNYYLVDTYTWMDGVDNSPLCQRGWVTQERALSIRTIHFGKHQLFWECLRKNATEVFPKGLLRGTRIEDPKIFLHSETRSKEVRMKKLQSTREKILKSKKRDEEFRARMREMRQRYRSLGLDVSEDDESDEEMSDRNFAKRLKSLQVSGQHPADESSESSDSDSDYQNLSARPWTKRKRSGYSIKELGLVPQDFVGCDLNILDGLDIKGWRTFKTKLESWGFGAQSNRVEPLPIRGMALELSQWISVVEIFSRCSLSFSKDKLVAIAGLAHSLSQTLKCDYLAGLWRRDLEHQLLWKVREPFPAPKRDGTRGPSWSWASVDGKITIPDWRGYFNQ